METAAISFLESDQNCSVDVARGIVRLSEIFKWYRSDFGKTDLQVAEFVLKYVRDEKRRDDLKQLIDSGKVSIKYFAYDWTHNAKQ